MSVNTLPLGRQVHQALLREILAGKRKAGERISEESIGKEFGISRTPAREALMLLSADGLVDRTARKGCRIGQIDTQRQRDLFECRAILEASALELGFERLSPKGFTSVREDLLKAKESLDAEKSLKADECMHELILEACPNQIIAETIQKLLQQCRIFRLFRAASTGVKEITDERLAIVDAILAGDKGLAGKRLRDHVLEGIPKC